MIISDQIKEQLNLLTALESSLTFNLLITFLILKIRTIFKTFNNLIVLSEETPFRGIIFSNGIDETKSIKNNP